MQIQRVNELLVKKDRSWRWLALQLSVSAQAAQNWKDRGIPQSRIKSIAKILGVSREYLEEGSIDKSHDQLSPEDYGVSDKKLSLKVFRELPVLDSIAASAWCDPTDPYQPGGAEEYMPSIVPAGKHDFCLRVEGNSMENPHGTPTYPDGCIIIVHVDCEPKNKDCVVIRNNNEDKVIFKQIIIEDDIKFLKPLNPNWPAQVIEIKPESLFVGVVDKTYYMSN